jgi:hypothetical protein
MRMARIVWAAFQRGNRRELDERKYLFTWNRTPAKPLTPEEYRLKAMCAWGAASGGIVAANTK